MPTIEIPDPQKATQLSIKTNLDRIKKEEFKKEQETAGTLIKILNDCKELVSNNFLPGSKYVIVNLYSPWCNSNTYLTKQLLPKINKELNKCGWELKHNWWWGVRSWRIYPIAEPIEAIDYPIPATNTIDSTSCPIPSEK